MFWFSRYLDRRRQKARAIYQFWDGQKTRYADPLQMARALDNHKTFLAKTHIPLIDAQEATIEMREEATTITLAAVREVFSVSAWSESNPGLTETETLDLLADFAEYLEDLKKNSNPQPISAAPTAPESSTVEVSATPIESDLHSTSIE